MVGRRFVVGRRGGLRDGGSLFEHPLGFADKRNALFGFCGRSGRGFWLMLPVAATVGFSRIYNGVHYPSDVIAGYLAGGAWLAICIGIGRLVRARNARPEVSEMA